MLYPMFALLLACMGAPNHYPATASGNGGPSSDPDPDGDSGEQFVLACPQGMSGVLDADGVVQFCIDAYEVVVVDEVALSLPDVEPTTGMTFVEARAACEATPVEVDGEHLAWKRLATSEEWQDAADGVFGPGGSLFPWGDSFDETACATVTEENEVVYSSIFPTESFPDCVSGFGLYDAAGNAFEWTDPGRAIESALFLAEHPDLEVGAEGVMRSTNGLLGDLTTDIAGVRAELRTDEDGTLLVATEEESWNWHLSNPRGYLLAWNDLEGERAMVEVVPLEAPGGDAVLVLRDDEDGQPMTDKRGGAFYVGTPESYRTDIPYLGHPYDFSGTIGFRCASEPVEIAANP